MKDSKCHNYIKQKDAHGCALACIAMVSGYDYDYVKSFYAASDFTKHGITFFDYMEYFVEHSETNFIGSNIFQAS